MKGDYFYSGSTGLYVSRKPLTIDARVKESADRIGINLDWNDEGIINNIDFDDSKKLLDYLGAKMLTPIEYWKIYRDAQEEKDIDMLEQLTSNRYTEWLDRVYLSEKEFIDHPEIVDIYQYNGKRKLSKSPHSRPGYFDPEDNIDMVTGEPFVVDRNREKFSGKWKYWSPDLSVTELGACAPIRGYVTSVGKPSYDLGIPVDSRQPKLMLRECRYRPLEPVIDAEIIKEAENTDDIITFIEEKGHLFMNSKDSLVYKLREGFYDRLGDIVLTEKISKAAAKICTIENKRLSYNDFADFIKQSKTNLEKALENNRDIIFVMGHKNPDTDTCISSIFEAYRNHLIDRDTSYIPVMQGNRLPDEVSHLIGNLSSYILMTNNPNYEKAKDTGLARWISVDQNREPEVQKYFISIIDHHIVSETAKQRDLPKTLEMLGSCSALITRKYLGMGLELDSRLSKILYGATLMDTENRAEHKMTDKDVMLMDYLKSRSEVQDENQFYGELMSHLLNTNDAKMLFKRDYKEDWGFGFAVAKIKNGFDSDGNILKGDLVSRLYNMAEKNNIENNIPLTLLKLTDYNDDNEIVNKERLYFIFNGGSPGYKDSIREALESIIRFEFPGENVFVGDDYIDFWGSGLQLSRKKTAPILEPLSAAFNRYFYSPSIRKYVKRDFQKKTRDAGGKHSSDEKGRINNINYFEAKHLADNMKFEMLSLTEYWKVLNDANRIQDTQMIKSLQGSNFVEFLDSTIIFKKYLLNHPGTENIIEYDSCKKGKRSVDIPKGSPGLIYPYEIDHDTGLPKNVRPPNEYGNPELWRYWEPDSELVVPCRSYIFLLDQPCLDCKFHPDESFPNLGIRPVVGMVKEPKTDIGWDDQFLTVKIQEEGDSFVYKWPKRIWDM